MAARQDQGLVFTLIAFVILFIICFVAAYVGWKSYGDSEQHVATLENELREERDARNKFQADGAQYLQWMGVGQFDNVDDVKKTFDSDMQLYGSNFGEDRQSYRNIVEYLAKENESISAREATAKDQLKEVKERLLAVEGEAEKKVAQYAEQMNAAKEDAAAERGKFKSERELLEAKQQELVDNLDKQEARYEALLAENNAKLKDVSDNLIKSERAKTNLIAERAVGTDSFEAPDGRISLVNQNGTVWINLGEADSLRRQIMFSVIDADRLDPANADHKGSIEVTRLLGDHMAEARITSDDPRNPILTGDQIYSQVWNRGKKLRFALTGVIDLDGDSRSDMQLARDLVELNGGAVDAYLADDGTVEGEITVNTRYLVLGEFPEQANQAKLQDGWRKMSGDAQINGVEKITLDKFLNQIGYTPDDRMVQLGPGARSVDFPPQPAAGPLPTESRGASPQFRPRTPNRITPPQSY